MIRGTTPILTFKIKTELDLSQVEKLRLTFKSENGMKERTWNESEVSIDPVENKIQIQLTQEETLHFSTGVVDIQIRLKINGLVYASKIKGSSLYKVLNEEIL